MKKLSSIALIVSLTLCAACSRPLTVDSKIGGGGQGSSASSASSSPVSGVTATFGVSKSDLQRGESFTLSYTSNATFCNILSLSNPNAPIFSGGPNGSLPHSLNANDIFTLVCSVGGPVSASTPSTFTLSVKLTAPPPPTCAGKKIPEVNGYCWYVGAEGQSCTTVCTGHGGYHDATNTYAGDQGTKANCQGLATAFGFDPSRYLELDGGDKGKVGCALLSTLYVRRGTDPTTADASDDIRARFCACNK